MTHAQWLLSTDNGHVVLAWAAILISLPFLVLGAAIAHHWLRPPPPDEWDDPARWGDQSGPHP